MKNIEHPIDQLFREALSEHEIAPSDGARKAFLKEASSLPPPADDRKKHGLIWLSGIALLLIFGITAGLWFFFSKDEPDMIKSPKSNSVRIKGTEYQSNSMNNQPSLKEKGVEESTFSKIEASSESQIPVTMLDKKSSVTLAVVPDSETSGITPESDRNVAVTLPIPTSLSQTTTLSETLSVAPAEDSPLTSLHPAEAAIDSVNKEENRADTTTSTPPDIVEQMKKSSRSTGNFSVALGASYTPEWIFNTLEEHNFVNNFGLDLQFSYGPFSIRTGAGASVFKGTNELVVSYNDYLGAYNKLDSMDFTWSEPTHNYLPTYFMSRQDVWDSLLRIEEARIVKRYTYLQVPLIFGYEMVKSTRFSLGLRIGPVLSVLLNTKQLSSAYDPGKNRVIHINDISPGQVNLNWQVMGGVTGALRLNERLRIEIEPSARYYFNSVYEKPVNQAKPWSIGVRAGLMIEL